MINSQEQILNHMEIGWQLRQAAGCWTIHSWVSGVERGERVNTANAQRLLDGGLIKQSSFKGITGI